MNGQTARGGRVPASDLTARAEALRALLLRAADSRELTDEEKDALAALENSLRSLLETRKPDPGAEFFT